MGGNKETAYKTRVSEHGDEVKKIGDGMPFTRGSRKASEIERHKLVITDHVIKENYVMDWNSTRIVVKVSDWRTRGI